jgi:hypothetical protein
MSGFGMLSGVAIYQGGIMIHDQYYGNESRNLASIFFLFT